MCICWTMELSLSPKVWKTVLCKEQKGHQETISFFQFCFFCNFDYRCHLFFFWWKLLKEKPETRSLSWGDAQRKCGQNKRQNAQSPRHPVHHATQICPVLYQLSGPFTDASCLEIRVHDRLYQCWDSFCTISVHFEYFLDSKAAWSKLWNKICM